MRLETSWSHVVEKLDCLINEFFTSYGTHGEPWKVVGKRNFVIRLVSVCKGQIGAGTSNNKIS